MFWNISRMSCKIDTAQPISAQYRPSVCCRYWAEVVFAEWVPYRLRYKLLSGRYQSVIVNYHNMSPNIQPLSDDINI